MKTMPEPEEGTDADVVQQLRLLADWVDTAQDATPELQIFALAAREIERLRSRIDRITEAARGALPLSYTNSLN